MVRLETFHRAAKSLSLNNWASGVLVGSDTGRLAVECEIPDDYRPKQAAGPYLGRDTLRRKRDNKARDSGVLPAVKPEMRDTGALKVTQGKGIAQKNGNQSSQEMSISGSRR